MRISIFILTATLLSACGFIGFPGVYKINVEQGNLVDKEMVDQLQRGMTRRQVQFVLGTPLVEDTFNQDRWNYAYIIRRGDNIIREAQMAVLFEGDMLMDVSGDYRPAWATGGAANPFEDAEQEDIARPEILDDDSSFGSNEN
ncbi:MAG: outer membrane protein assembly factor BamE [Parahaliea sp.]